MSSSKILKPDSSLGRRVESYRFESVRADMSSRSGGGGFVPFLDSMAGEPVESSGAADDVDSLSAEESDVHGLPDVAEPPGIPEELHILKLQESYDKGFEEGKRQAERGLSSVFKALRETVEEVAGLRELILRDCEEDLLKLAVMVARKVIHQEICTDRLILAKVVSAAVSSASERDEIVIRLNPEDHRLVSSHRHLYLNGVGDERVMDLKPDDTVPQGGCVVDTSMGEIDARTDSQVDEIFRRLLDERNTTTSFQPKLVLEREQNAYEEN